MVEIATLEGVIWTLADTPVPGGREFPTGFFPITYKVYDWGIVMLGIVKVAVVAAEASFTRLLE
jgi:hypothetical protein